MSSSSLAPPPTPPAAPAGRVLDAAGRRDRRFVTAALMLVMALASMEMTVTSTAMPSIIGDLHGLEHYSWVASVYLLCSTVAMPLYGRLADAFGRKRVIIFAILLFTLGSVAASTSTSMTQLILCRGVQGLGAAGIMPVVLTILGDIFTLKERAAVQGFFSALWGTTALAGPALGALLVNTLGWRSIFYVNLPFGLLGIGVLLWKYREHEKPHSNVLDLLGAASLALACTSLLMGVSGIGPSGGSVLVRGVLLLLGVAAAGFFIRHERATAHPIMDPRLLVQRAIGPALLGSFLLGAGYLSLDTYVPLYIQGGRGGGATAAAGVVAPVIFTWSVSALFAVPLAVRAGFRKTGLLGTFFIIIGFAGLLLCALTTAPRWMFTTVLAVTGLGMGPCSTAYLLGCQEAVQWQQRGMVTSSTTFFRTMGGALGIGLLGGLFNLLTHADLARLSAQGVTPALALDPKLHDHLPAAALLELQQTISQSLTWVFLAMLILAILQAVATWFMAPHTAHHPIKAVEALEGLA